MGTEGLGDGSPQRGPGAEPHWGSGAKNPEARYAYTICSGQTYFCHVFIEDIRCTFGLMRSLLPLTLLLQKLFEFVQISRPTLAEVRAHPCPTVATPLLIRQKVVLSL